MANKNYYESQKDILNRMLSKVEGLNTNEGSTAYMVQSPMSIELEQIKSNQNEIINQSNIVLAMQNGYDDSVIEFCRQDGIERKLANKSVGIETFYGTEGSIIPVGYIFGNESSGLLYKTLQQAVIGSKGEVDVLSISEKEGEKYNAKANTLTYMTISLVGVTSCTNKNNFENGADDESIDDLYYRHELKMKANPNGVNDAQFEYWALECDGVGSAKVYACKNASLEAQRGHVCIVITNSEGKKADETLCNTVKNYIAPDEYGEGKVMMCILHVISATELTINVSFKLTYSKSYSLDTVKTNITSKLEDYLKNIRKNKETKVSYSKLGSIIYTADGVLDYDNLLLNNAIDNITISENQTAVLGSVDIA